MTRIIDISNQNLTSHDIEEKFPVKIEEGVAVFDATDWEGDPKEFFGFDDYWVDICKRSNVDASVLVLPEDIHLSKEVREHIGKSWNENAKKVSLGKAAIVAPKLKSKMIELRIDQDLLETKAFESYRKALRWAKE